MAPWFGLSVGIEAIVPETANHERCSARYVENEVQEVRLNLREPNRPWRHMDAMSRSSVARLPADRMARMTAERLVASRMSGTSAR